MTAIDSFAALGVKVMITELDVDVLPSTREGQVIGVRPARSRHAVECARRHVVEERLYGAGQDELSAAVRP